MEDHKIIIFGIAGSLRKGSYNMAVLKEAARLAPKSAEIRIYNRLGEIPPFNQDYEREPPEAVTMLKNQIRAADAILIATPEYNYSVPGVLKNAIDWASRPYGDSAWLKKPVALMSASISMLGGARAQYQLRQSFIFLDMYPLNQPEVIIPEINNKMDSKGRITDEHTRGKIRQQLDALVEWTIKLKTGIRVPTEEIKEGHPYEFALRRMAENAQKAGAEA